MGSDSRQLISARLGIQALVRGLSGQRSGARHGMSLLGSEPGLKATYQCLEWYSPACLRYCIDLLGGGPGLRQYFSAWHGICQSWRTVYPPLWVGRSGIGGRECVLRLGVAEVECDVALEEP